MQIYQAQIEKEIKDELRRKNIVDDLPGYSVQVETYTESLAYGPVETGAEDVFLDVLQRTAENRAFRALRSRPGMFGKVIIFVKRAIRKCLKWYLEPVCDQQTEFNHAVVALIEVLLAQQRELEARLGALEQKGGR